MYPEYPICDHEGKPKTFDERLSEGKSLDDGLAGAMPLRHDYEKPWSQRTHRPTRSDHEDY